MSAIPIEYYEYVSDKKSHKVVVDHTGKNARFIGTLELEVE